MKKYIVAFLMILGSVSGFAQKPHTAKDLLGKWEGKDSNSEVGGLFFLKNNKAILTARGSYSPAMNYTTDFTTNPVKIDLVVQNPKGRINIQGLLQFIDNNTIKFQLFPGGNRPGNFDPLYPQNIVILKRGGS
ncbi:MAG: hypothetical protein JST50_21885 [Bacteroidetes bacterium]|jgi:hypothetical protein|nr:hypothetical protein [Bacteroidota bacterium]